MSSDCGSVHDTGCRAPTWYRAGSPSVDLAVAASLHLVVVQVVVEYLAVVLVDVTLQVRHTPVANFDGVFVQDFVEGVVSWEAPHDDPQELCPHIGLHIS